jgi:hypothetical protein
MLVFDFEAVGKSVQLHDDIRILTYQFLCITRVLGELIKNFTEVCCIFLDQFSPLAVIGGHVWPNRIHMFRYCRNIALDLFKMICEMQNIVQSAVRWSLTSLILLQPFSR